MCLKQAKSLFVLITFLVFAYGSAETNNSDVSREDWNNVASYLRSSGAPYMSVKSYDPQNPNLMIIVVSGQLAQDLEDDSYQCKKLVQTAKSKLGNSATVIMQDDTGRKLASVY